MLILKGDFDLKKQLSRRNIIYITENKWRHIFHIFQCQATITGRFQQGKTFDCKKCNMKD